LSIQFRSPLTRYGLPLASVGLISLLFFLIGSNDRNTDLRCFAFAVAILLSALLGGPGPGLLATGLSAFANAYLFFPPIFSIRVDSEEKLVRLTLFIGDGIALAFIGSMFRNAKTVEMETSWRRYLPSLLFVFAATGVKLLAFRTVGQQIPFTFFYAAIAASAWVGGFGAGLLATFLASMTARYFFLEPKYSFAVSSELNAERVFLFIGEGVLLSGLSGKYAGARRVARAAIAKVRLYEQRLKQSIEDLRALRLTSEDVVWEWDIPHDRIIRGATTIERPQAPVSAMNYASWLNHIHPEDRSAVTKSIESVLFDGQDEWHCEYRRLRPGGKFVYVSDRAFVFRDAARYPERMVGRTVSLSHSKRPPHLPGVPVAEERHPTVLEQNPIAVLVTDGSLHIVSANGAATDVLGYSPAELKGIPLENLFLPEKRRRISDTLSDLNPSDYGLVSIEENCLRNDGKIFRGSINSALILGPDGSSGRVIMIEHASNQHSADINRIGFIVKTFW
jgi:PAS domain S-box-containing protein